MGQFNEPKRTRSHFMEGLTRILDIRSNFNRRQHYGAGWEADVEALRSDWVAIGRDMRTALRTFEQKAPERIIQPRQGDDSRR
jgi:hypothetical protein